MTVFPVTTVGWCADLVRGILDRIEDRSAFRFSHLAVSARDEAALRGREGRTPPRMVGVDRRVSPSEADRALLASLERSGVPTLHNMILGDRVTRHMGYEEVLAYASVMARRLQEGFEHFRPSLVLGGFDNLHGGLGLAVARKLGLPWVAMHFSTIPKGLFCFCGGTTPDCRIAFPQRPPHEALALAEATLKAFETKTLAVPLYLSANSVRMVLERFPAHVSALAAAFQNRVTGRSNPYVDYPVRRVVGQYVRKRANLLFLPHRWFLTDPPSTPYALFGLHLQPESSVDVWAPFYADQVHLVETIARAMPPDVQLLVKLHRSDADGRSRRELDVLRRLPGVSLVSPFASSRAFVERAAMVFAIQGTMALEAALLGKPVLQFGRSGLDVFPSVRLASGVLQLPEGVREGLRQPLPPRDEILQAFATFLGRFWPGCYNDWKGTLTEAEIDAITTQFQTLRSIVAEGRFEVV